MRVSHRAALLTACCTYVLLLAGGLVHSTDAGLACPDWPLCYGMFFPPMVGNIRFEHGHRLIAATVGILTLVTTILIWKKERASLRPLAGLAAGSVLLQIVLGGLTVIYRLPDLVSTAHLAVGTAFFSMLVILSLRTSPGALEQRTEISAGSRSILIAATLLTYLQMVMGGLVRHTESGLACLQIPTCQGQWIWPITTPAGLHMAHRFGSLVVTALVLCVFWSCRHDARLLRWSSAAVGLVLLQIYLGVASIWTRLALWPVMSHLGAALALLVCLLVLCVTTRSNPAEGRMRDARTLVGA